MPDPMFNGTSSISNNFRGDTTINTTRSDRRGYPTTNRTNNTTTTTNNHDNDNFHKQQHRPLQSREQHSASSANHFRHDHERRSERFEHYNCPSSVGDSKLIENSTTSNHLKRPPITTTATTTSASRGYDTGTTSPGTDNNHPPYEKRHRREDHRYYRSREDSRSLTHDDRVNVRTSNFPTDFHNSRSRSSSRGRFDDDWKCMECLTWNKFGDKACRRCKAEFQDRFEQSKIPTERDGSISGKETYNDDHVVATATATTTTTTTATATENRHDLDVDEFGRKRVEKNPPKVKKCREWPPCFETNGTSYVFDSRSGMFYEAESDFFYDPKSKLYYGNKKKSYYKYIPDKIKHFEQVLRPETTEGTASSNEQDMTLDPVVQALKPKSSNVTETKNKVTISITLKTKALQSSSANEKKLKKDESGNSSSEVQGSKKSIVEVAMVGKKHAADIEKWTERQVELRKEVDKKDNQSSKTHSSEKSQIATTEKGEPICVLCRRKFPTLEKLRYHERVSELHKENLLKKAAEQGSASDTVVTPINNSTSSTEQGYKYVDRAQQRRLLHGLETVPMIADAHLAMTTGPTSIIPLKDEKPIAKGLHVINPADNLGQSNIGNQMLQKLGWKQETGLGSSNNTTVTDGAGTGTVPSNSTSSSASMLANEWARIESIAAANGEGSRKTGVNTSGIGAP